MSNDLSIQKKITLACMGLGIVIMLGASFIKRIEDPDLVRQTRGSAPSQAAQESGSMPMNPDVGKLMQELQSNPNDIPTIIHLTEHLIEGKEWTAAENFIHRALELEPKNAQGHYLHGIILYNTGKHDEAASAFEQVVAIGEDASARYSLGILQIYHFKNIDKGIAELERGLNNPEAHDELKNVIRAELEKAKAQKNN